MAPKTLPPGAGDVTLTLGDTELTLKPTLNAALTISRQAGGIRGAIDKAMALDLDTIVAVIRLGIGPKEAKRLTNLDQLLYENGLLDSQGEVLAKVIEYLTNIARGGRPASDEDKAEGPDAEDPTQTSATH